MMMKKMIPLMLGLFGALSTLQAQDTAEDSKIADTSSKIIEAAKAIEKEAIQNAVAKEMIEEVAKEEAHAALVDAHAATIASDLADKRAENSMILADIAHQELKS